MLDISKTYQSNNFGEFKIVEYINCYNVKVEFTGTGYQTSTRSGDIINGEVKDKALPNVYGVGFVGSGNYKPSVNGNHTKQYRAWKNMMCRCYYHANKKYYGDCSVVKEWHNFQVFAKWFDENYTKGLHLDKDIKIKGNKVYGPDYCLFVTRIENIIDACAKHYKFINPDGVMVELYNLAEFCRGSILDKKAMSAVHLGKAAHHKGWTKA